MLDQPRGVVLVSAPPGYGKTTLIGSWLAGSGRPFAWLTLEESDNDVAVFLDYLLAAAARTLPGLSSGPSANATSPQYSVAALTPLINALDDAAEPLAIVLDDYHVIGERAVHDLVAFLATHLPPGVQLVVGTREDPPLPLSRLRARGQLTEIRAAELRLDAPAAGEFLRRSMRLDVSDTAVELLNERTEGWVAGLQLAGLSLQSASDPQAFVDEFDASDRFVVDYLVDEALARQPADIRAFLADTCVLDKLTGSLCDALTGRSDGPATLVALERANMFLTALDERRDWYRYHALFADLLRSSLSASRRAELHHKAASWFEAHGLLRDAIHHALAAGDGEAAATRMDAVADDAVARGEFRTVETWCRSLPQDVLERHPKMRVSRAWARFFLGDLQAAEEDAVALRGSSIGTSSTPRLAVLDSWLANRRDDPDAAPLARQAIEAIPESDPIFRSLAFTTMGEALIGTEIRDAAAAFSEAHRLALVAPQSTIALGTVYSLANADLILGRRREAEELCRTTIGEAVDRRGGAPPSIGMIHIPLGISLFEADELGQARQQLALGLELCDRAGLRVTMLGGAEWQEIQSLHALGETQLAWRRLDAVRREAERHGIERVAFGMQYLAAELLVVEGDATAADRRLARLPEAPARLLGSTGERIGQVRATVMLALGRPAEALTILDRLAERQRATGRLGRLVWTLALAAAARDRLGERENAISRLKAALRLAADEAYRRAFVAAPGLDSLLHAARSGAPEFVGDILARRGREPAPAVRTDASHPVPSESLPEPLTVRELEVLRLVVAGLSNDEIGRELYVTPGTAKWHVHNLLGKLGARDRIGLAARSRALRLV